MVDPPFSLYTSFPRKRLEEGEIDTVHLTLISVEMSDDSDYDPIQDVQVIHNYCNDYITFR